MDLPIEVQDIIDQMHEKYKSLAYKEDDQRKLTFMIAEQIVFSTGSSNWGCKSADPNRPQSPSNIAWKTENKLFSWRWLDGDGSISGIPFGVAHPPVFMDITGQNFIPVKPVNHLLLEENESNPVSIPNDNMKSLLDMVGSLIKEIKDLHHEIDELGDELTGIKIRQDRRYVAKIFGATIVISPEQEKK